ncbi:MAG: PDDEXK nuclease domain-containing protein, partial [bacterium]
MNNKDNDPAQPRGLQSHGLSGSSPNVYSRMYDRLYRFGYHRKSDYSHAKQLSVAAYNRCQPASVLDVGCSLGWTLEFFGSKGARAVGVDVSQIAVNRCRKLGRDARVASASQLPFQDGEFELVISTDCLEHLTPTDALLAVREMARVSRKGIAIKVNPRPDRNRWWRFIAGSPLHLTCIPVATWLDRFADAGFTFVERQKRMIIDGEDFYLDLLFFHRKLKRLIAIELKIGQFKAAYKGQMELYLNWLDKYERQEDEQ